MDPWQVTDLVCAAAAAACQDCCSLESTTESHAHCLQILMHSDHGCIEQLLAKRQKPHEQVYIYCSISSPAKAKRQPEQYIDTC